MKAAQFFGKGQINVVDVAQPQMKDGEVLIEIEWCGICGSDLAEYTHGPFVIPSKTPHPITQETLPVTLGHEFCGRIKNTSQASRFKVGQAVVADPRIYCRSCHRCNIKDTVTCDTWGFRGLSGGGGGFSEFVSVHESQVYAIPDSLLPYAALIEPLAVAWHAVKQAGLKDFKGKACLIIGGGPIGIALLLVLRVWGVEKIIVSEPTVSRREQNKNLADLVLNPVSQNVGDECRKVTNGEGVDVAFDAAGVPVGLNDGFDALAFKGIYVNVAGWERPMTVPFMQLMLKELHLTSSRAYNDDDFEEVVNEFVKGKFEGCEKMVTSRISLENITQQGFEGLIERKDEHIKILVTPKLELLGSNQ